MPYSRTSRVLTITILTALLLATPAYAHKPSTHAVHKAKQVFHHRTGLDPLDSGAKCWPGRSPYWWRCRAIVSGSADGVHDVTGVFVIGVTRRLHRVRVVRVHIHGQKHNSKQP